MNKSILKSKTFWFGVVVFAAGGTQAIQDILPAEWMPYALAASGVLSILLRLVTNSGVTLPSNPLRRNGDAA